MRFGHGNFSTVHLCECVGPNLTGVALDAIKTERQSQDRDHDHEPVAMFAEDFDHVVGRHFTNPHARAKWVLEGRAPSRPQELERQAPPCSVSLGHPPKTEQARAETSTALS